MTETEAMKVVNNLTFVVQRMRSMAAEEIGTDETSKIVLADLQPWVHGEKSILPALTQVQDRGSVTAGELYNFCYIAHHLEPSIAVAADIMATAWDRGQMAIPRPELRWMGEWR